MKNLSGWNELHPGGGIAPFVMAQTDDFFSFFFENRLFRPTFKEE